jgi:hypothetical protein
LIFNRLKFKKKRQRFFRRNHVAAFGSDGF